MGEYGVVVSSMTSCSTWNQIPDTDFTRKLFQCLQETPDAIAFVDVSLAKEITYSELSRKVELVARHLLRNGCQKGDIIALFAPNSIEWIVFMLAIVRIGSVPATINSQLQQEELRYQLLKTRARSIYTHESLASLVVEVTRTVNVQKIFVHGGYDGCVTLDSMLMEDAGLPILPSFDQLRLSPDDPFIILFSGGTTGLQKAVLLSHRNLHAAGLILCHPTARIISKRQVIFSPLSHIFGSFMALYGITLQGITFLMKQFQFTDYLKLLQDNKIENILIVPPIAVLLAKSPEVDKYRLTLKYINSGSAPLSATVEDQLMERFPGVTCQQMYGLTEVSGSFTTIPVTEKAQTRKPTSVGPPFVNVEMKVIDLKTSKPVGPNINGEICVKGPTVMLGYLGDDEATAATIDQQGWLHTGDIGYYDEDGYFYVVDRLKELIKYNAYQVAPAELEAVLLSHPQVADAGVVGQPDPKAGELPTAWVVKKQGATVTEQELEQFVSGRVAQYKRLRGGIRFVASIPKTMAGKILRREMKKAILNGKL